ncbi:MAG: hypothetical protein HY545_02830 [Candidatus Doudnabacteria bacterium]|nr:hypothetical protein [Candidatus Doudnabacteria bacterium]
MNEMDLERDRIRIEGNLRLIEENRQKRDQLQAEFDEIKTRHGGISQEEQARLREIERLIRQLDAETARLKQENQSITP